MNDMSAAEVQSLTDVHHQLRDHTVSKPAVVLRRDPQLAHQGVDDVSADVGLHINTEDASRVLYSKEVSNRLTG